MKTSIVLAGSRALPGGGKTTAQENRVAEFCCFFDRAIILWWFNDKPVGIEKNLRPAASEAKSSAAAPALIYSGGIVMFTSQERLKQRHN